MLGPGCVCSFMLTGNGAPKRWSVPILPPFLSLEPPQVHAGLARSPRPDRAGAGAVGKKVAGGRLSTEAVNFLGPTPQQPGAGTGRFGQEGSGEVIITCLSFSRDV